MTTLEFDESTLDEVARLVCGDDGPLYRKGWEIRDFFSRAKIKEIPEFDGPSRRVWTRNVLDGADEDKTNAERVITRLADRREYPEEQAAFTETCERLNRILMLDGLKVEQDRGRPRLVDHDPEMTDSSAMSRVELAVAMTDVLSDPAVAAVAQRRLDEARICHSNRAYTATIIMLGSLLESILVGIVADRLPGRTPKPLDRMGLQELLDLAHKERWIDVDVHMGSVLIRTYRNLVHPRAQLRMNHAPDADTVDMCWPIVNATLNDLAASRLPL